MSVKLEECGRVFILRLTGDDDDRPDPTVKSSLLSALVEIKSKKKANRAFALITIADANFFSKIYDGYAQTEFWACGGTRRPYLNEVDELVAQFIVIYLPAVAIITGDVTKGLAAACGFFMLKTCHEHVIMRTGKGAFHVNTLESGMTLKDFLIAQKARPEYAVEKGLRGSTGKEKINDVVLHTLVGKLSEMVVDEAKEKFRNDLYLEACVRFIVDKLSEFVKHKETNAEFKKVVYVELCCVLGLAGAKGLPSRL